MAQSHLGPHGATEHALRTLGGAVLFWAHQQGSASLRAHQRPC